MIDVLVIGGGNAALCAALAAREAGATVCLLEAAPREWRGGNSVHTRNLRCMHDAPQDVLTEAYPEEEFWQDLKKVTAGKTDEAMARLVIRESARCRSWMQRHGVRFQPSLSGTLHLSRTNAFFMGGGKALVNAYYRSADALGVAVRYGTPVRSLELQGQRFVAAHLDSGERIEARACVVASGGFESNRAWLREAWGRNERGEWPADNFLIRGTRFNQGVLLKDLFAAGADAIGDATQAHMVAIDARAPLYDGGICTRVDCVSLGIMVNRDGQRFYDEGEDFWPKRYAIWGRLVALQPGQVGHSIIDAKAVGRFMPPVFRGAQADTLEALATELGLPVEPFVHTVRAFNAACRARHVRPCGARRLRHRRSCAAKDALGATDRHAAVLRLHAQARRHLHLPRCQSGRTSGHAVRRRGEPEPVRGRRGDGRQRARPGLHRRRGHDDRHGVRPHRRRVGGGRGAGRCARDVGERCGAGA